MKTRWQPRSSGHRKIPAGDAMLIRPHMAGIENKTKIYKIYVEKHMVLDEDSDDTLQ
jgi:hypothetical protein